MYINKITNERTIWLTEAHLIVNYIYIYIRIEACGGSAVGHRVTGPGAAAALIDRLTVSIFTESWISVRTPSAWDCLSLRVIDSSAPRQTPQKTKKTENQPWFTDHKGTGDRSCWRGYVSFVSGRDALRLRLWSVFCKDICEDWDDKYRNYCGSGESNNRAPE